MVGKDWLICVECEHFEREYAPECSSCSSKNVIESEPVVDPVLFLDDGCRWVRPLPAAV